MARFGGSSLSRGADVIAPYQLQSTTPSCLPSRSPPLSADTNQLDKLLNNPDKEIRLPTAPKERTLRAPVEMMKSVQGSSSGAGSGEFHVYKQSRRREYERIKLMEDKAKAVSGDSVASARMLCYCDSSIQAAIWIGNFQSWNCRTGPPRPHLPLHPVL